MAVAYSDLAIPFRPAGGDPCYSAKLRFAAKHESHRSEPAPSPCSGQALSNAKG